MRTYLFSNRQEDLAGARGDPLQGTGLSTQMEFVRQPGPYGQSSITLTVQGVDACTTAREWEQVWETLVVPVQNAWRLYAAQVDFQQRHRQFPNEAAYQRLKRTLGRRPKPPFSIAQAYLPLWQRMREKCISFDKALGELRAEGKPFDRRNAQRGIIRLEALMRPRS